VKSVEEFTVARKILAEGYEQVLRSGLLPVGEMTREDVSRKRAALEEERFAVAVCGQIKSGKSTLLNALVFGRAVLPSDDTVMTAKNTLLRFGDREALEVTFYNEGEWYAVQAALEKDASSRISFDADVKAAAEAGVYRVEHVLRRALVWSVDGVERLHEFVTPVGKGGRYSPFVKQVVVFSPHPWLREVTVADTPGTNDPLRFREDLTKKWVGEAGAVLYVAYAGQAMAKADTDFIDTYLLHVPSSRRVIAINKMDTTDDTAGVAAYMDSLCDEPRFKSLFGSRDSVVYCSGLAGLLAEMVRGNRLIEGSLQDERERLDDMGFLDAQRHRVAEVRERVERRLLANKGDGLIEEHKRFLESLTERKKRLLCAELECQKQAQADATRTGSERVAEIKAVRRDIEEVTRAFEAVHAAVRKDLDRETQKLDLAVAAARKAVVERVTDGLEQLKWVDLIRSRGAWMVHDAVDEAAMRLYDALEKSSEHLTDVIRLRGQEVQVALQKLGTESRRLAQPIVDLSVYEAVTNVVTQVKSSVTRQVAARAVEEETTGWQRLWNTRKGVDAARGAVGELARETFDRALSKNLVAGTVNILARTAEEWLSSAEASINERLDRRKTTLEDYEAGARQVSEDLERAKARIEEISAAMARSDAVERDLGNLLRTLP